jgi:hypothetical protein
MMLSAVSVLMMQASPASVSISDCLKTCTYEQFDERIGPEVESTFALLEGKAASLGNNAYPEQVQKVAEDFATVSFQTLSLCQDLALRKFAKSAEPAETVVQAAMGTCPRLKTVAQKGWRFYIRSKTPASLFPELSSRAPFPLDRSETRQAWLGRVFKYREVQDAEPPKRR